jgi:hypothetical protein
MKKIFLFAFIAGCLFTAFNASAQMKTEDKSKRPSPPDSVMVTTGSGVTISVNYSQPAIKGRTIGKEIAPYGKVWRTGANEATVFTVSKDVMIDGKALPAGKYGLYSIPGENEWVIIFNKTWNQWGTKYVEGEDALRITVKTMKAPTFTERLKFMVDKSGKVSFVWGNDMVSFKVK